MWILDESSGRQDNDHPLLATCAQRGQPMRTLRRKKNEVDVKVAVSGVINLSTINNAI